MGNNFEVVQCTLLNKLIGQDLLYFENVGQVVIMEWLLLFKTMGKEVGEAEGRHCNNSSLISMLVYLWFFLCSSFSFSSLFKGTILYGWNIVLRYLFVFVFVCSTYKYCTNISAPGERNLKGHCSGPTPLSYDSKQLRWYNENGCACDRPKESKEESDIHS